MRARPITVKPPVSAVVAVEVIALGAWIGLAPAWVGWWPAAVVTAVAAVLLVVQFYRHNAAGWAAVVARHRRRRKELPRETITYDVRHGDTAYGVRDTGDELITMIAVAGRADAPTLLRGPSVSLSTNVIPLRLLAGLLDQPGGLHLAIDVVNIGQRVRRANGYPPLYSTLLADKAAAGQRDTHLVARIDVAASTAGLAYRTSVGAAAAAATERIIKRLEQHGLRAAALTRDELNSALARLSGGLALAPAVPEEPTESGGDAGVDDEHDSSVSPAAEEPGRRRRRRGRDRTGKTPVEREDAAVRKAAAAGLHWRSVKTRDGYLSTYYFSPEDITTINLNHSWALRADEVTQITTLFRDRSPAARREEPVMVSAVVRVCEPQAPTATPTLALNPLPGLQFEATLIGAPTTARPRVELPARALEPGDDLAVAIGSTGLLVGAASIDLPDNTPPVLRGDWVMLPIVDPQRVTQVAMDTSDFYARQQLLRAAALGERIVVYSANPRRWAGLSQPNITITHPRGTSQFVPTIIVNDRLGGLAPAGSARTVITLGRINPHQYTDIQFMQISQGQVQITTESEQFEIDIVAFKQEQAWAG